MAAMAPSYSAAAGRRSQDPSASVGAASGSSRAGGGAASELSPLQPSLGEGKAWSRIRDLLLGPGLLVCLADTDGGCIMVAAQSGARWGYSLLWLQVLLVPILFLAQELTVRLGVHTRQGHTACIKMHFGAFWAWFACVLLVIECAVAMVSELKSIASVSQLWGATGTEGAIFAAGLVIFVVFSCSYRQVEAFGIGLGCFEFVFVATMFIFHPNPMDVARGFFTVHADEEYIKLIAANIGAVIMPWMIYFQQSAVVARRLRSQQDCSDERFNTMIGSVVTQLVMIGALITLAAVSKGSPKDLRSVKQIVDALSPAIGYDVAKIIVSLGIFGGSLCAAFVVSLAAVWAICEAAGYDSHYSLDVSPRKAPEFYLCFLALIAVGLIVLLVNPLNIVTLSILVEMVGAFLLPFTVGFLYLLATGECLPPEVRVKGLHKWVLAVLFTGVCVVSCVSATYGFWRGSSGSS